MDSGNRHLDKGQRLAEIIIHEALLTPLLDEVRSAIGSAVASEIAKLREALDAQKAVPPTEQPPSTSVAVTTGVEVTRADKLKAADLRTSLLLGKLPEDAGVLIDTKTTAQLLNVSPRMVYRLDQEQAMPASVRIGRLVRWRLAEIIEWIDSDCPPRHRWAYSGHRGTEKRKSR